LGFSRQKGRAIGALAREIVQGPLDLETLAVCDNAAAAQKLPAPGDIGRWIAEYALLRGLGRLDVFPGDDGGAQQRLRRRLGLRGALDHAAVERLLSPWRPYAGMIYFHWLLDGLDEAGRLSRA
jgi:DNA-3-methyladenine glycosylase II